MSQREREERSNKLVQKLLQEPSFRQAKTVTAYLPFKDEVNIQAVFKEKKEFSLPKIKNGLIVPVKFSGNEEVKVKDIDLVVVPGRAFTPDGMRIGRGLGLYDHFLATFPDDIPTISLAFNFQIFSKLPVEEHDIRIGKVITER